VFSLWARSLVQMINCEVTANNDGGGLVGVHGLSIFEDDGSNFHHNTCLSAAVVSVTDQADVILEYSRFVANQAAGFGAVLSISAPTLLSWAVLQSLSVYFHFVVFSDNTVRAGSPTDTDLASGSGGAVAGLYTSSPFGLNVTVSFRYCNFTNNSADAFGGAVYAVIPMDFHGCRFTNNRARDGGGVAFALPAPLTSTSGTVLLADCTIEGNHACGRGGGLYTAFTVPNVRHWLVLDSNQADDSPVLTDAVCHNSSGGGIFFDRVAGPLNATFLGEGPVLYSHNYAPFGDDYASDATRVDFSFIPDDGADVVVYPGFAPSGGIAVSLYDRFGALMTTAQGLVVQMWSSCGTVPVRVPSEDTRAFLLARSRPRLPLPLLAVSDWL
jgi:hypothetical protein